ncbi:MAG: hypothetical protein IJH04_00750 [Eggerthellaceae bacterium]|nr:hypothetical protein [Eggerthellaceae bacterium]
MSQLLSTQCPVCRQPAVAALKLLFLGPLKIIRCRNCNSGIGLSPTIPVLGIMYSTLAFPAGAIFTIWQIQSFGSPLLLILFFILGGVAVCVPAVLLVLFFGRLIVKLPS